MLIIKKDIRLILLNIRSVHNVGSLFRTADGAGVSMVYLIGYTPSPVDRFGRKRRDIVKVSLGAEQSIPWRHSETLGPVVESLFKEGFCIVALEQSKTSVDYKTFKTANKKIALIVGNEVEGIPVEVIKKCHTCIEIPMRGHKESLNVAVAGGIALYELATTSGKKPISLQRHTKALNRNGS